MKLVVEQGVWAGRELPLAADRVVIGRSGQPGAERIVLPEPEASRQHLRLERGPMGWTVTDLGSTNGTFLNGQQLRPHEPHPLHPGDRLAMGGAVLLVQEAGEAQAAPVAPQPPPAEPEVWPEAEAPPRRVHPLLLALGSVALLLILAGAVLLLVLLLRPTQEVAPTATPGSLPEQVMTVVPTEFQDIATAILPIIPTDLPLPPPLGPTPTPESAAPADAAADGSGFEP